MQGSVTEVKNKLAVKSVEVDKLIAVVKELEAKLNDKSRLNEEARRYAELQKKYELVIAELQAVRVVSLFTPGRGSDQGEGDR